MTELYGHLSYPDTIWILLEWFFRLLKCWNCWQLYFCRATLQMFTFSKGIKLRAIQYHALHKNVVHVKDQQRKDDFSVGCYWKTRMYSWLWFNCCYIILQYTLFDNRLLSFKIDKLIQVASKWSVSFIPWSRFNFWKNLAINLWPGIF